MWVWQMSNAVANTDEFTIKLTDKLEFKAKILGLDKPFDVAVLKIEAQN
jgi:serine protease Do